MCHHVKPWLPTIIQVTLLNFNMDSLPYSLYSFSVLSLFLILQRAEYCTLSIYETTHFIRRPENTKTALNINTVF